MATMTLTNGATVTLTFEELAQLFNTAATVSQPAKKTKKATPKAAQPASKAETKAEKLRREHDAILDSKRVERMANTAAQKIAAAGFDCKISKQGVWIWLYPTNGAGRTPEFKAVKLPKGWKHSMKRGAFYRNFKGDAC